MWFIGGARMASGELVNFGLIEDNWPKQSVPLRKSLIQTWSLPLKPVVIIDQMGEKNPKHFWVLDTGKFKSK